MTVPNANLPVSPTGRLTNNSTVRIAIGMGEYLRYGLILPCLVRVISTMEPMTGSLSASKSLAARNIHASHVAETPATSVMYSMKNVVTNWQMMF